MTASQIIKGIRENPTKFIVFMGEHCAIHDGRYAHTVSRTVALAAIQFGRMKHVSNHTNGQCWSA